MVSDIKRVSARLGKAPEQSGWRSELPASHCECKASVGSHAAFVSLMNANMMNFAGNMGAGERGYSTH
jgi:hypothetical protein